MIECIRKLLLSAALIFITPGSATQGLFALLMWEALFAPAPSAFGSAAQDAPHDLLSGGRE